MTESAAERRYNGLFVWNKDDFVRLQTLLKSPHRVLRDVSQFPQVCKCAAAARRTELVKGRKFASRHYPVSSSVCEAENVLTSSPFEP